MTIQAAISYFFYGMASISVFCFASLVLTYWKRERHEQDRQRKTRADIGDIAMIFQTMRDIVDQQKSLAREFNEDLDKKMAVVKQVLSQSLSRNEELYERQRQLSQNLDAVDARLQSIERQAAGLESAEKAAPRPSAARPETPLGGGALNNGVGMMAFDDGDSAESVFGKASPVGLFAKDSQLPEAPVNPERAREAFRALLDMEPHAAPPSFPHKAASANASAFPEQGGGEEDKEDAEANRALRNRVKEYCAAGMTVPEIARELGIGKGEVRLMISLQQQQRP